MAKRKKSKVMDAMASAPSSGSGRTSIDISDAENGFVLNVSGESGGKERKYWSKKFISPTREGALMIASSQLSGSKKSKGKKSSGRKKISMGKG